MARGVEVRIPFLDRAVVDLVHSLPPRWKTRWWGEKHLLREAARGLLPEAVRTRRKYGMREPRSFWNRQGLLDVFLPVLREAENRRSGAFRDDYLRPFLRDAERRSPKRSHSTTRLVQLEFWHRLFLDPPAFPAAIAA
jgi:asparagine synthase (glutamine-hydrolysing)